MTSTHDARYVGDLARVLQTHGYVSMLITAVDLQKTVASLRSWNVEGTIVINTLRTEAEQLRGGHDVPMLFSDNYTDVPGTLTVHADGDFTGGRVAAEHLIDNGHRDAVFLGPVREITSVDDERWRGFCDAFAAGRSAGPEGATIHRRDHRERGDRCGGEGPRPRVRCSAPPMTWLPNSSGGWRRQGSASLRACR